MPSPLSALSTDEQGLYAALGQQPHATDLPALLADNAEDRGEQARTGLLHQHDARLALWELLRDKALTDDDCARVLQQPSRDTARQISQLLGPPDPKALLPDLLTEDGLHKQLAFAQTLLAAYGLPAGSVTAAQVQQRLHDNPTLREQIEHGRSLLLLVPRVRLADCTAALTDGLRRNEHLLGLGEGKLKKKLVYIELLYKRRPPEYLASKYGAHDPDRWLNEEQWVTEQDVDALFIEPSPDVPDNALDRSAEQAWESRRPGEALLTPQAWCILFLTLLERRGQVLDSKTWSLLSGARIAPSNNTSSGLVPHGNWNPKNRQAKLDWNNPDYSNEYTGSRVASEGA